MEIPTIISAIVGKMTLLGDVLKLVYASNMTSVMQTWLKELESDMGLSSSVRLNHLMKNCMS